MTGLHNDVTKKIQLDHWSWHIIIKQYYVYNIRCDKIWWFGFQICCDENKPEVLINELECMQCSNMAQPSLQVFLALWGSSNFPIQSLTHSRWIFQLSILDYQTHWNGNNRKNAKQSVWHSLICGWMDSSTNAEIIFSFQARLFSLLYCTTSPTPPHFLPLNSCWHNLVFLIVSSNKLTHGIITSVPRGFKVDLLDSFKTRSQNNPAHCYTQTQVS